jgi:uncharacterized protein (DUF39 family)
MNSAEKSISHINTNIKRGTAIVMTEQEFMEDLRKGVEFDLPDIDIITTAFCTETSGTAALIGVPVAERGVFTRAKKMWLNGIPGYPGPAPNERLGLVEGLFFAAQFSNNDKGNYSGAQLMRDVIRRDKIEVECLSVEGDTYKTSFVLDQAEFARMYVYNCFFRSLCSANSVSSKDSHLKVIKAGTKILLNKATGIVIGCGTRSTPEARSLSLAADMFEMDPEELKEREESSGTALKNTIALAIPVLTEDILKDLKECLKAPIGQEAESDIFPEAQLAEHLKQRVKKGDFLLNSSDMSLDYWF